MKVLVVVALVMGAGASCFVLGAIGFAYSKPAREAAASAASSPVHRGTVKVDRVWDDGSYTQSQITYENNTTTTFSAVTIECIAHKKDGSKLNSEQRSFFKHERGPIYPGFRGSLKIGIGHEGYRARDVDHVRCTPTESIEL